MLIDPTICNGCGECLPYCPMEAISLDEAVVGEEGRQVARIDRDECVECIACLRAAVCSPYAIRTEELVWPRILRRAFSDPLFVHDATDIPGRGTEEVKTNDVTGLYGPGVLGVGFEFGRPGVGTRFRQIERATVELARLGIVLVPDNPLSKLIPDPTTGRLREEILDEKVLSAIIQCIVQGDQVQAFVQALFTIEAQIDTVFSLALICCPDPVNGRLLQLESLQSAGVSLSVNGKVNVGLGRPLCRYSVSGEER